MTYALYCNAVFSLFTFSFLQYIGGWGVVGGLWGVISPWGVHLVAAYIHIHTFCNGVYIHVLLFQDILCNKGYAL